jgi:uncharacterized oligopeptide transporter (OPT) family protein
MRAARALGIAGALAALNQFWAEGLTLISPKLAPYAISTWIDKLNKSVLGQDWIHRTVVLSWDPVFMAAGALTGLRVCSSMMVSATLCWAVFVPILQQQGVITGTSFAEIVKWTLWGGVACMVTSGLLSFVLQWRSALRAFGNLGRVFSRTGSRTASDMAAFNMPWWQTLIAVLLTFLLALVACRVTGETDTTPVSAMGKVTQLIFGVLSPGNMIINLMSANITAGASIASADLLTDLKSGYLLGANPRKQFLAQLAGIFSGTVVTVLAFRVMVPNASVLGSERFPAPSAQAWKAVAEVMSHGIASLGPVKIWCIAVGGLVGILLPLLAKIFPKHEKWIPSAAGFGLAWTFHWYYSWLFFLGALVGYAFEKKAPKQSEEFTFPVASGLIAGGAIMGVILIFCENGRQMLQQLFGG